MARNSEVLGSNLSRSDVCHRGCAGFKGMECTSVHSAAYGTVHHKVLLKSFEKRVGNSHDFGLLPVTILP